MTTTAARIARRRLEDRVAALSDDLLLDTIVALYVRLEIDPDDLDALVVRVAALDEFEKRNGGDAVDALMDSLEAKAGLPGARLVSAALAAMERASGDGNATDYALAGAALTYASAAGNAYRDGDVFAFEAAATVARGILREAN